MQDGETVTEQFRQETHAQVDAKVNADLGGAAADVAGILARVSQLEAKAKVALVRGLMTQLDTDEIPAILEFGLREIGDRHRRGRKSSASHHTRLLLKKDYSYQSRGLSEPTQYYVYLRRRKPKLDRYIGTLFYVPQGCKFSYFLDAEGRIIFNSPHNVFQLRDHNNPAIVQIVRLICLEPPPPDYTFSKQQNDVPEIYLHLEYLDLKTYQSIAKQAYPFPVCMHEGGRLDRYRWEVSTVSAAELASQPDQPIASESFPQHRFMPTALAEPIETPIPSSVVQPQRQILNVPLKKSLTFRLTNPEHAKLVLKRLRLWVNWSSKAMPQAQWELVTTEQRWILMNARFKRQILCFDRHQAAIILEHSLPILMKWFHDLSLAVSQSQTQKRLSATQLTLAHSLLVEMNLPQSDPLVVLKQLFGVQFTIAAPPN